MASAKRKKKVDVEPDTPDRPPRRSFLRKLWIGLGAVAAVETLGLAVAFLRPWKPKPGADAYGGVITAGPVDRFKPGSVTPFRRGQFYLVRLEDGGFLALSRKCTHLGCTVIWRGDERQFVCPCHASVFDAAGGVLTAPAPRPLDTYEISIENSIIRVDTSKPVRRDTSDNTQVTRV